MHDKLNHALAKVRKESAVAIPDATFDEIEFLENDKRYEEMVTLCKYIYSQYPRDFLANYFLASAYDENKQYDNAVHHFGLAIKYYSRSNADVSMFELLYDKADALNSSGRYEEALEVFSIAAAMYTANTGNYDPFIKRAAILFDHKQVTDAIKCLHDSIIKVGHTPHSYFLLASYLAEIEELDAAIEAINYLISRDTTNHMYYYYRGVLLIRLLKYENAIVDFDKALELNSTYDLSHACKGVALNNLQRFEEAKICFDKALELNPHCKLASTEKAELLGKLIGVSEPPRKKQKLEL